MARWSRLAPATDRRLVKGLHDGDDEALATLYDLYAERLYDYSMALLGEPKAAADVLHDTFIDAARRAPRLRERELLRPWLYAALRRRCRQRKQPSAHPEDEAYAHLDYAQWEALFLAARHEVTDGDLAAVLGISPRRTRSRLTRARRQVADAGESLSSAEPPILPASLRHRVLHTGSDPELAGYRVEIAARGGALTADGMPRQPDAPSPLARRWTIAGIGLVASLATTAVALVVIGPGLPMPYIPWPGQPSPHKSHSPRPHRPGDGPRFSLPGGPPAATRPTPTRRPPSTSPAVPGPGKVVVSPASVHFRPRDKIVELSLSADGGAVTWAAVSSAPQLTLSSDSGRIPVAGRTTISLTLDRGLITLPGRATVTVTDGTGHQIAIPVSWDISLL